MLFIFELSTEVRIVISIFEQIDSASGAGVAQGDGTSGGGACGGGVQGGGAHGGGAVVVLRAA